MLKKTPTKIYQKSHQLMTCISKLILKSFACMRLGEKFKFFLFQCKAECWFSKMMFYKERTREGIKHNVINQKFSNPAYITIINIGCNFTTLIYMDWTRQLAYKIVHILRNLWAHQSSSFTKVVEIFVLICSSKQFYKIKKVPVSTRAKSIYGIKL